MSALDHAGSRKTEMRAQEFVQEQKVNEINGPGELFVDPSLIERFTDRGWEVLGEGRDQIVLGKPGSASILKIVGEGSLPRRAEIRRYVGFFRQHQRNPHFPRVGPDRELEWNGKRYYAYSQERLKSLPGDEQVLDYLERFIGNYDKDPAIDERDIPPGLSYEQVDGLAQAMDQMFRAGFATTGYDLSNVSNIMQRANGQLVIVDPFSSFDDELDEGRVNEVQILSKVKGKGSEPSQLPRFGRYIEPENKEHYLGKPAGKFRGYEIWQDWIGGQLSYHLFDPREGRVVVTTFGSQYKNNPKSYIIHGLYASPGNPVRAHEFYHALVKELGLTLISDRKQSPGGNRVWQNLERYPDINIYGYDTRTGEVQNFGARDAEMYTISSRDIKDREGRYVAKNLRLVATAK
jgi:hypothetical protein